VTRGFNLGKSKSYSFPVGNKCRNLALQVGGVSNIKAIKHSHERDSSLEKYCASEAQQQLKTAAHINKTITV
jgi:hypothetical protein